VRKSSRSRESPTRARKRTFPESRKPDRTHGRAAGRWLTSLKDRGFVRDWRLLRRKFGLASGKHTDFILEIEFDDMTHLDRMLGSADESDARY